MGAKIDTESDGTPPLHVHGGQTLKGIDFASPVASAQVKSAVLLAGLYADGETTVSEPHPTRDYSERMLRAFGVDIDFSPGKARLRGGQRLRATDIVVPADFSSAAFFLVAASIIPGSELRLRAMGLNPRRTGLLAALRLMGADISEENHAEQGGEGRLGLRLVLAGGLAQLFGTGFDVQDVIAHLERQPQCTGEIIQLQQVGLRRIATQRPHPHRRTDQRAGLQCMHALQGCQRLRMAGGIDVQRLATAHAGGAGRVGQRLQAVHAQQRRQRGIGQQTERTRLQRITGEDRGGFVEGDVRGGATAT